MKLNADPATLRSAFSSATPFPHVVIDRLFPEEALNRVLATFPLPQDPEWERFDNPREHKLGNRRGLLQADEALCTFLMALNSAPMLDFLERLTGIPNLIPDPDFGGGGLHQIVRGGFLKIHADFNWHPKLQADRRLNMLLYLNKDWKEEYGGHLELWDRELRRAEKAILPLFNRTVIFATTDYSFHGHPQPLDCPEGLSRKSVSIYYYTHGRPEAERSSPHDTLFPEIPRTEP
jgi:2-oxoglutarate-Fe(II)-dependent oxygenase superfamily protein